MPYVMVPVPEEHVEEVMQLVLRARARAAIQPWDAESVGELFAQVDEPSRALMAYVARATMAQRELDELDAARMIELSPRETLGIMRELNDLARAAERPQLIVRRTIPEVLPGGSTSERRLLTMAEDVAALIEEAERAELRNNPGFGGAAG